jgi:heme/copper-type cytochrome/quinol oxidase subunit 2
LTFVADKEGSFRLRCSVTCGAFHPFMTGKLEVGQNLLIWRATALAVLAAVASLGMFRKTSSP